MRKVLPKWGVVWQTKGFSRDKVSAPAAIILDDLHYVATILGRVTGKPIRAAAPLGVISRFYSPCHLGMGFFIEIYAPYQEVLL